MFFTVITVLLEVVATIPVSPLPSPTNDPVNDPVL